jgi:hypothetical protein
MAYSASGVRTAVHGSTASGAVAPVRTGYRGQVGPSAYDDQVTARSLADHRFRLVVWSIVGIIGWLGVVALGAALWQTEPRAAGFDWELVLEAGRRVAAGSSPYDPAILAGPTDLEAVDLFYSYPPPLAQAVAPVAGAPSVVSFLVLDLVALVGLAGVVLLLVRARPELRAIDVVLPALALLPLVFPVSIALVFGNVDVLYPLVYGSVLLGAIAIGTGRVSAIAGGAAVAAATIAKIHPGGLGLWLLVRGWRERRLGWPTRSWLMLATAVVTSLAIVSVSVLVGGIGPWQDYARVVGVVSGADVVVWPNIAPAAQVALLLGLDAGVARALYVAVLVSSLLIIGWAAGRVEDTVFSLAIGSAASLVLLPIAWYHYPPALIPFALAAIVRARGTRQADSVVVLVGIAGLVASAAILWPFTVWFAVALVLIAIAISPTTGQRVSDPSLGTVPSVTR